MQQVCWEVVQAMHVHMQGAPLGTPLPMAMLK